MNTPRTKPPIRAPKERRVKPGFSWPAGSYANAITNPAISQLLGEIGSLWPHVEEQMIVILEDLSRCGARDAARKIFRSIVNEKARIDVLKALLERTNINRTKSAKYDDMIHEFSNLNRLRNTYLHGLWWTHVETGNTYFSELMDDEHAFFEAREVKAPELQNVINRMEALYNGIYLFYGRQRHEGSPSP